MIIYLGTGVAHLITYMLTLVPGFDSQIRDICSMREGQN